MYPDLVHRDATVAEETCEILQSEEVKEFFSKEDCAAAEQAVEQRTSCQEVQKSLKRTICRFRGGGGKSKDSLAKGKRKPITFLSDGKVTVADAQKLLPEGFRAYKDQFNKCWRAYCSKSTFSCSRSWGYSGKDAVVVWEHHLSLQPKAICPWDFSDVDKL